MENFRFLFYCNTRDHPQDTYACKRRGSSQKCTTFILLASFVEVPTMGKMVKNLAYLTVRTLWMDPKPELIIQNLGFTRFITSIDGRSRKKILKSLRRNQGMS